MASLLSASLMGRLLPYHCQENYTKAIYFWILVDGKKSRRMLLYSSPPCGLPIGVYFLIVEMEDSCRLSCRWVHRMFCQAKEKGKGYGHTAALSPSIDINSAALSL